MFGTALRWLVLGPHAHVAQEADAQRVVALALPAVVSQGDVDLTLRLLTQDDRDRMLRFARALPPDDLLFLRRDITNAAQVDSWLSDVKRGLVWSVAAVRDDAIVGYATVAQDGLTWTAHVAELRILVDPELRGIRLGRLLMEQAFALARDRGIKKMMAQMAADQTAAYRMFTRMGFAEEAVLHGQVRDRLGQLHDLRILSLDVDAFQAKVDLLELTAAANASEF